MNSKRLGILGERVAKEYLEKKGYQVLDKNYYPHFLSGPKRGEIDVIAKKGDIVYFIEVKSLRDSPSGTVPHFKPEDRVDFKKRRKIAKVAETWLRKRKIPLNSKWQIDVISVIINLISKKARVRHFQNV